VEQRKEIVTRFVSSGLRVRYAVSIAGISKSCYYYKPKGGRKGKTPSMFTWNGEKLVDNEVVIHRIEQLLSEDFIDYGYQRTTEVLKQEGYRINDKKVYRLMKEKRLLYPALKPGRLASRGFVKYTVPRYEYPFSTLEIDIKYLWIQGVRRNGYLITVLDTFTRMALGWRLDFTMKASQVADLLKTISNHPLLSPYNSFKVFIRSDNGPQFISKLLAEEITNLPFNREFIHPGTPQQNAHIESFHSTLQKLVVNKYCFESLNQARETLDRFYFTYNHKRSMKAILYRSPIDFLKLWETGKVGIRKNKKNKEEFFFRESQKPYGSGLSLQNELSSVQSKL
jgi:putative transposase